MTIAVIMLVAGITIPAIERVRMAASSTKCQTNLRQIGAASLLYSRDHDNITPPLGAPFYRALWPYLYGDAQINQIVVSGSELPGAPIAGSVFECPLAHLDKAPYITAFRSYGANQLLVPGADQKDTLGVDITLVTDPSRGALFGDVHSSSALRPTTVNGRHGGLMNVVFVDGHVAPVELTEAITTNSAWNDNPFWIGTRR